MTLGERLRAAREKAGLTQGGLASRLGRDRNTVNRVENGHNDPQLGTLRAWAEACGVTLESLIGTSDTVAIDRCNASGAPANRGAA